MSIKLFLKYLGIITLLLSYGLFIWNIFKFDSENFNTFFNTAWIFGALSLVFNAIYAILIKVDDFIIYLLGCSGLIWFVPFFIDFDSGYGILSLLIYFLLNVFIHKRKLKNSQN